MGKTMFEKIWDHHLVTREEDGSAIIYIDRHLVHEVTSPQAFEGLRLNNRPVRVPGKTMATMDHNIPTDGQINPIQDPISRKQVETLEKNCAEFGIKLYGLGDPGNGIVHVIAPEKGITLPGMTIVCGDSHTSTHGAFGALAFGIGTSEVEHVLATQTLRQSKPKTFRITVEGELSPYVEAKDVILYIIGQISAAGGNGYVLEFAGSVIRSLSMEGRMTLCNMSIEAGARAGLIAPDETTFEYVAGREFAPRGEDWDKAVEFWKTLPSDSDARFDRELNLKAEDIAPQVTWGTNPGMVTAINNPVPDPEKMDTDKAKVAARAALDYMDLKPGTPLEEVPINRVFIGSCTNSRLEDLERAAAVAKGRRVSGSVKAIVVPGSHQVKAAAEEKGLDKIFTEAGFEWREPGCSMCLAMNSDVLEPGDRCASTSNRNFEGRQGKGSRTHLVSPEMAVAAAVNGKLSDVRKLVEVA